MLNFRFSSLAGACLLLTLSACDNGGAVPVQDMPPTGNGPPVNLDPTLAFICEAPRPESLSPDYTAAGCFACHGPTGSEGGTDLTRGFASFSHFELPIREGQGNMPIISVDAYPDAALLNDLAYLMHPVACDTGGSSSASSASSVSSPAVSSVSSVASSSSAPSSSSSSASSIDPHAPVTEGPAGAYSFCVNEAEWNGDTRPDPSVCEFEGTREVFFGANGQFYSTPATGSIACTADSFGGDPIPHTRKACFISDSVIVAPGSSSSAAASSVPSSVAASSSSLASSSSSAAVSSSSAAVSSSSVASSSLASSSSSAASSSSVASSSSSVTSSSISSAPASSSSVASSSLSSSSSSEASSSSSLASSSSSSASSAPSDFVCDAPKPAAMSSGYTANNCSLCHGPTGGGTAFARAINNFELFEDFERGVRVGTNMGMSAYPESVYSQADLLNDFAFIHYDSRCGTNARPLTLNSCDVSDEDLEPRLIALTERQLLNTLGAVFEGFDFVAPTTAGARASGLKGLDPAALDLPEMEPEQWHALETTLTAAGVQLSTMVAQECAAASRSSCSDWLLTDYAPQLWRRPVTDREILELTDGLNAFRSGGAGAAEEIAYALQSLLLSPNFLFRTELGDPETHPNLGAYEIASRLSYTLWHSSPDAELYQLAADNQLSDPAVFNAQVERMIADPRFQGTVDGLISSEFLTMEEMLDPNKQLYGLGLEAPQDQACRVDWEE